MPFRRHHGDALTLLLLAASVAIGAAAAFSVGCPSAWLGLHGRPRRSAGALRARNKKSEWQKSMDEQFERRLKAASEARAKERGEPPPPEKPTPRYVRPEDMNSTEVDINWENQVRFESQKFGNRYNQNEILRKNLGKG